MGSYRPTVVVVLGWIFIGLAALTLLSAGMGLLTWGVMGALPKHAPGFPKEAMPQMAVFQNMFRYFGPLIAVQMAGAVFVIVSAAYFLKLRAWARTALEAMTWIAVIWQVVFGLVWTRVSKDMMAAMMASMPPEAARAGPPIPTDMFTDLAITMAIVMVLFYLIPCAIIIWLLRGRTVREAMRPAF
ncbi:MAG: hypothetical protein ACE149_02405 [Armatimonadota bacterium]